MTMQRHDLPNDERLLALLADRTTDGLSTAEATELRKAFGNAENDALDVTAASFVAELAWARTFLPHASLDAVLASGRGQGVEPGSVVLLGPRGPVVPVRGPDECVRHKALDLLGDLALAGVPLLGRFEVVRGTHALHHALVRAVTAPEQRRPRSG